VVFHLGDLALGKKEDTETLVPLLNGKVYLMRGNHDRRSIAFYQALGIMLVKDQYRMETASGMQLVFSHRPIVPLPPGMHSVKAFLNEHPVDLRMETGEETNYAVAEGEGCGAHQLQFDHA